MSLKAFSIDGQFLYSTDQIPENIIAAGTRRSVTGGFTGLFLPVYRFCKPDPLPFQQVEFRTGIRSAGLQAEFLTDSFRQPRTGFIIPVIDKYNSRFLLKGSLRS